MQGRSWHSVTGAWSEHKEITTQNVNKGNITCTVAESNGSYVWPMPSGTSLYRPLRLQNYWNVFTSWARNHFSISPHSVSGDAINIYEPHTRKKKINGILMTSSEILLPMRKKLWHHYCIQMWRGDQLQELVERQTFGTHTRPTNTPNLSSDNLPKWLIYIL